MRSPKPPRHAAAKPAAAQYVRAAICGREPERHESQSVRIVIHEDGRGVAAPQQTLPATVEGVTQEAGAEAEPAGGSRHSDWN